MGEVMIHPILKPKDMPRVRASIVVRTLPDKREICNLGLRAGLAEYRWRTLEMLERQGGVCCLCMKPLRSDQAYFEHEAGRGLNGGHRDDRISLPDGTWINGAACYECNSAKASKRIDYNRSFQK